jgi:hypothetical protein
MSIPYGRRVRLSPPRKLIVDLMRTWRNVPTATVERRFKLFELEAQRRRMDSPTAWTVLFAKAFAMAAADAPELRRSYIRYPTTHLYEHPEAVAIVAVERDYQGEDVVLPLQMRGLLNRSTAELDLQLRNSRTAPVTEVDSFRRSLRLARMPWPLRGCLLNLAMHGSGRLRETHFGTFFVSSPASQGAGLLHLVCGTTAGIHYGLFDEAGNIEVRLTFDHRALDGAPAARALKTMEAVLCSDVLRELQGASVSRRATPALRLVA